MLLEDISLIIPLQLLVWEGELKIVWKRFSAKFFSILYVNCPHKIKRHPQFIIFFGSGDTKQPHAISNHLDLLFFS